MSRMRFSGAVCSVQRFCRTAYPGCEGRQFPASPGMSVHAKPEQPAFRHRVVLKKNRSADESVLFFAGDFQDTAVAYRDLPFTKAVFLSFYTSGCCRFFSGSGMR